MATTPSSATNGNDPSVTITDTETWEKNKRYTVYKVVVNVEGKSWFIFRRYQEFSALYDKLKKRFPDAHLKLPGKKFFGNFDPDFIKNRREGLHDFVQKLVTHPGLSEEADVLHFLNITQIPSKRSSDDDDSMDTSSEAGERSEDMETELMNLGPSEKKHARPSDFEFLKVIGKGSFGKVLLAKHKQEQKIYAVKVLQKSQIVRRNEVKHIMAERNVLLKSVQHPFLVGLHYSFQTQDKLYFVLDYVNGGELFFHLQKERNFSEPRAKFYAAEIASALGYLHSLNIIYRDLKPENLLLDQFGHVVLTDFGLCKENIAAKSTTSTFCGTPEYLAPEVLRKQPYDWTVDWWCLGAVLYEMLYGLPPFYSRDTSEMYDNILHKPLKFRGNMSSQAKDLLGHMLQKDKTERLGCKEDFKEVKKHIFFSDINWEKLNRREIKPPYNPNVNGQMDLRHFDPDFIKEPVPASVGKSVGSLRGISASVQDPDQVFAGFSYAPPMDENFQ